MQKRCRGRTAVADGSDQVPVVAMSQDNWQIVAAHLGGPGRRHAAGARYHPARRSAHMINDAQPIVVLTRGQGKFRDLPTMTSDLPERPPKRNSPSWLDDPTRRLRPSSIQAGLPGYRRALSARTLVM